jgi:hypothetical protein
MALRDTTWVFNTGTRATIDANSRLIEYEKDVGEEAYLTDGTHLVRTHNIITREWVAVTEAAAQRVCDCKAVASNADDNTKYRMKMAERVCDAWTLTKAVDSLGPWGAA